MLGDLDLVQNAPAGLVAIVGTRDASPYGVRVATELARLFAAAGIGVVSGLARGIDSAAHRGALDGAGRTIAVLGTGVDVPYPVGNRALHEAIATKGSVISESPPGTTAKPGCFPRRNRIIAALAKVTIVVEAPYKSGAINTASQALELGRIVAAVPGPIDSARSAGANLLLRDGAQVIASAADALALYGVTQTTAPPKPALGGIEADLWDALDAGSASPDTLGARIGLPIRQVLEGVARLELSGLVRQSAAGEVERVVAH